jgi:selenobiotic family peptide radical SAM maturase
MISSSVPARSIVNRSTIPRDEADPMPRSSPRLLERIYPLCRMLLGTRRWKRLAALCRKPPLFAGLLEGSRGPRGIPPFISDLARLEWAVHEVENATVPGRDAFDRLAVNPALRLLSLKWKGIPAWVNGDRKSTEMPKRGDEIVLVWRRPETGTVIARAALEEDLLALKMIVEGILPEEAAETGSIPVGAVDGTLRQAAEQGILISPSSRIRRDPAVFPEEAGEEFLVSPMFTLQWHITQACDLRCKHCYDRSRRSPLSMKTALRVLDELREFCRDRFVGGQVSFSGGNPLLYPKFLDLYRAAVDRGFPVVILGNPAPRTMLERIVEIRKPAAFQVSLEGLETHNDRIRGRGTFRRVMEFLDQLRELGIYSMVMLTLTRDNLDQVLPLAEFLRDRVDLFTFNRLSRAGKGTSLALPGQADYIGFLAEYLETAGENTVLGLKDNLLNIIHYAQGDEVFGGCTGYGCGAAFNFMTLLPDGEVHACRKFPSLIGNIRKASLAQIYDSEPARRYRSGSQACLGCPIRAVCGGCLASTYSVGRDVFTRRDPYCFIDVIPCRTVTHDR